MHIEWTVSVGFIVTWIISGGAALVTLGRLTQLLQNLVESHKEMKAEFHEHVKQDQQNFEGIQATLLEFAMKKG